MPFAISIHAAREGGDDGKRWYNLGIPKFQSTPPVKAATGRFGFDYADADISIHAAREGGDPGYRYASNTELAFQSTPPVKAATLGTLFPASTVAISIHAAREGGDLSCQFVCTVCDYFNPRRP